MNDITIIGSGLAAVSAAKEIIKFGIKPLVIDVSYELEDEKKIHKEYMRSKKPSDWKFKDIKKLLDNPTISNNVPKKLYMGSDFFYGHKKDHNILFNSETKPAYSFAYGGLANGWGSAVLPLDNKFIKDYPIKDNHMLNSYHKVLKDLPYSAVDDGLSKFFNLIKKDTSHIKLNRNLNDLKENFKNNDLGPFFFWIWEIFV